MSPWFFSLGVAGTIEKINQMEGVFKAMSYIDDTFSCVSLEAAQVLADEGGFNDILREENTGLVINGGKTEIFDPWAHVRKEDELDGMFLSSVKTGGIEILGAPLCGKDPDWLQTFLEAKVAGLKPLLDKVRFLEPQHALHIMRHCVNAKLNYLWRSVPAHTALGSAAQAEELIWDTLCGIIGVPEDQSERVKMGFDLERARRIFFLPAGMGGGGFNCPSRNVPISCIAGIQAGLRGVSEECKAWWQSVLTSDDDDWSETLPGDIDEVRRGFQTSVKLLAAAKLKWREKVNQSAVPESMPSDFVSSIPETLVGVLDPGLSGNGGISQQRTARFLSMIEWGDVWLDLPMPLRAIFRAQSGKGVHCHLLALPSHRLLYLDPAEMLFLLRSILLLPLSNLVIPEEWLDGKKEDLPDAYMQFRHILRDADRATVHTGMLAIIREMLLAVGVVIYPEKEYSSLDGKGAIRRVDFVERVLSFLGRITAYDFTSVSVDTAPRIANASLEVGCVAEEVEDRKCRENVELCEAEGWDFTPLGMEETGNFGAGLKNLIRKCSIRAVDYPEAVPMDVNWSTSNFETFWSQALRMSMVRLSRKRWMDVLKGRQGREEWMMM